MAAAFAEAAATGAALAADPGCIRGTASLAAAAVATLRAGGSVFWVGNGGSAAEAQHAAAELMGRFLRDRAPLRSMALTVDTSALTAIGNDYGFDEIFARQLRGLARAGDLLIALTTSGRSANVWRAVDAARALGVRTAVLTGAAGQELAACCDLALLVPSLHTARIQEAHLVILHTLCGIVEAQLGAPSP